MVVPVIAVQYTVKMMEDGAWDGKHEHEEKRAKNRAALKRHRDRKKEEKEEKERKMEELKKENQEIELRNAVHQQVRWRRWDERTMIYSFICTYMYGDSPLGRKSGVTVFTDEAIYLN